MRKVLSENWSASRGVILKSVAACPKTLLATAAPLSEPTRFTFFLIFTVTIVPYADSTLWLVSLMDPILTKPASHFRGPNLTYAFL